MDEIIYLGSTLKYFSQSQKQKEVRRGAETGEMTVRIRILIIVKLGDGHIGVCYDFSLQFSTCLKHSIVKLYMKGYWAA